MRRLLRRVRRTWKPLLRQRQFGHRQKLSRPGKWAERKVPVK